MPADEVAEPDKLREWIIELRRALAGYLRKTRTRSDRLAVTSIVASALGALVTAGPAARGNNFIAGLQQSLNVGDHVPLGQVICGAAFVVALVAAVSVHLSQRLEKLAHMRTAEECGAELEALRASLDLGHIDPDEAFKKYQDCIRELSEVPLDLPPGGEPRPPEPERPLWRRLAAVGVAATVLLAAVVVGFLLGSRSPVSDQVGGVRLEGISQIGPAPFTQPVGEDQPGEISPPWAGGVHTGNAAALYAMPSGRVSCDRARLLSQLRADPAKAATWVRPMGVGIQDLDRFVSSLTPALLRADTAVTDYGYADGSAQPGASVLQMGTAVLVNGYGEPTVKCVSGDPLTEPASFNGATNYVGTLWDGFEAGKVCVVAPAPAEVRSFVVEELPSGHHVNEAAGAPVGEAQAPDSGTSGHPAGG